MREMAILMDWVGEQKWQAIIGGDFNEGAIETAQLTHPSMSVVSPGAADRTCIGHDSATTIDYFLVANRLMSSVSSVATTEAAIATHWPVVLQLSGHSPDRKVRTCSVGKKTTDRPVVGPRPNMEEAAWQKWDEDYEHFWGSMGRPTTSMRKEEITPDWWDRTEQLWSRWLDGVENYVPGVFGVEGNFGRPFEVAWKKASDIFRTSPSE